LLVLPGKIVLTDRTADMVEGGKRFAGGMQGLALMAGEAPRPPDRLDRVNLVVLGDRREAHDLPRLLPQDVTDEVILVQALHDDDNGALLLVVLPAVEGVVKPVVGGLPLGGGERLLGF
jgi:hypothetical protein